MTAASPILIVEDNAALAENLSEILLYRGFSATVVHSAEEALDLLRHAQFAGIITDLRLPGMSGVEFLTQLRATGRIAPIVAVSAFADASLVARLEELGALDVLPKPVDLNRLFDRVREFGRSRTKVLIVEDSQSLADNIAEALRHKHLDPIIAPTLEASLAQRTLPHVAVVDVRLPDGNGFDAIRRLRARDPTIRILITTGYAEELPADAEELDCIDRPILEKPVRLDVLLERIEAAHSK